MHSVFLISLLTLGIQGQKAAPQEIRRSIHLKQVTPVEVLQKLSEEYGFNFIAEEFLRERAAGRFDIENKTLPEALTEFQNTYQRNRIEVEGILVFPHRNTGWMHVQERDFQVNFASPEKKEAFSVSAERLAAGETDDPALPARTVSLSASAAPVELVLRRLADASLWRFSIGNESRNWRVGARVKAASPGRIIQAMGILLDATPSVSFFRSKAQEAHLAYDEDPRHPREKDSEKLRSLIEKFLTQKERDAIANQELVTLPLSRLKKEARQAAESYIAGLLKTSPAASIFDQGRLRDAQIVFAPLKQAPGGALGVMGYDKNGEEVWF